MQKHNSYLYSISIVIVFVFVCQSIVRLNLID